MALPDHFLGERKTHALAVKSLRGGHVLGKQIDRPQANDLERARQGDAVDIVAGRQVVDMAIAAGEIDAGGAGALDLLELRYLRQLRGPVEGAVVHAARFAVAV